MCMAAGVLFYGVGPGLGSDLYATLPTRGQVFAPFRPPLSPQRIVTLLSDVALLTKFANSAGVQKFGRNVGQQLPCRSRRQRFGHEKRVVICEANGGLQIPNATELWEGVKNPVVRTIQRRGFFSNKARNAMYKKKSPENEEVAESEICSHFSELPTVDTMFPDGELSVAAVDCIEQFSRLNGFTGKKMRSNFESSVHPAMQKDPRNLVEFTCFRYLARCTSDLHPSLKEAAFRRLTFSAMLAWQRPYKGDVIEGESSLATTPGIGRVGEEAFIRIATAITGAADRPTAHGHFRFLAGEAKSLTFDVWDRYCSALCKLYTGQQQQQENEGARLGLVDEEYIVRVESDTGQPIQKWSNGNAWPGRLTLTDHALYFEANALGGHRKAIKLDLTGLEVNAQQKMVGPFGVEVFNSAISVASDAESDPWVLEFVDFTGAGRRDTWLAFIEELFSVYAFIREYGVQPGDALADYVSGAKYGHKRVLRSAALGITRLLAVQAVVGKPLRHSERLLQYTYLRKAPGGELVLQALAVSFWAGRMEAKSREIKNLAIGGSDLPVEESGGMMSTNLVGTDGTVYLRKWATSPSWTKGKSSAFWKHSSANKGFVLGRNHVVGGLTQVERAVKTFQTQANLAEETQATIDAALLTGIPPNFDLLKELFVPIFVAAAKFEKLRRWESPGASLVFLFFAFGIIYMNWLKNVIPFLLLSGAAGLLALRLLKRAGRLQSDFGKVTIREQPPTNTIQQILALKDGLSMLEDFLQNCNIALLKLRTVALSREPRVTNEVLIALAGFAIALIVVPFRFLLGLFVLDQFTNKLKFRQKSMQEMFRYFRDWWATIPATSVVVLPPEKQPEADEKLEDTLPTHGEALLQAVTEWFGEDGDVAQLTGGAH